MTEVAAIVEIRRLKEQGLSKRAVARRLGISRETVRKYWEGSICFEQLRYSQRALLIEPFVNYITEQSLPLVPGAAVPLDASLNVQVEKRDLAYYQSAGGC